MEVNLAILLMNHILIQQSLSEGRSVRLAKFREAHGIPKATFYRHVNTLLENRVIERYGRDRYGMHSDFISRSKAIREYRHM